MTNNFELLVEQYGRSAATTMVRLIHKGCDYGYAKRVATTQLRLLGPDPVNSNLILRYRRAYPEAIGGDGPLVFPEDVVGPEYNLTGGVYRVMCQVLDDHTFRLANPQWYMPHECDLLSMRLFDKKRDTRYPYKSVVRAELVKLHESGRYYCLSERGAEIIKYWEEMGYTYCSISNETLPNRNHNGGKLGDS